VYSENFETKMPFEGLNVSSVELGVNLVPRIAESNQPAIFVSYTTAIFL
jgi:hypothetical protein